MSDVNANIGVQIDTSAALAELKALQRQLAQFHSQVSKSSAAAAAAQKNLQTNLINSINATGKFRASMGIVRTSTESFTNALEKNKFSMREYFRYAGGASKTFGKLFKSEFDTIGKVAEERVKRMQTQYIKMGRDATGAMKAIAITPTTLDMKEYGNQVSVAAQKQQLLNQLLKQGSTNLLNFGKNTQWAGRQLMVGFTIPLAYFGTTAAKTFMDLEAQALKFRRVYGDMFTTTAETNKALDDIRSLADQFTKYGVAVAETMEMAASAAAMGKTGAELTQQVANATRLAVLGNVEQEQALETTISLTNAFGIAAEDLTTKINFLNAVENQTVTAIEDLTIAIPKAGPVVQQLGGSVEDLAFFLTAMKEGGINASEGANALKSGLASLINPTKKASEMLGDMGINIKDIVERNKGQLRNTVVEFAKALDTLDPLNRARAIEQLFGKFQFARLSTLFQNVTKDGTQAARVLDLAGASVEQLAILSERELKAVEDAVGTNFKEAMEQLKVAIAPIGGEFLKAITPVVRFLGDLFEKFNNLSDGSKRFIVVLTTLVGLVGPTLLMTFGLVANGAANIIKMFVLMRQGFLKLSGNTTNLAQQTQYMSTEQMEAATVAASLNQSHARLTQQFILEADAVRLLRNAYIEATTAAARFAAANPGMMVQGAGRVPKTPGKFATGTTEVIGGQAGKDSVPSLLMPGEAVIPTKIAQDDRFKPLIAAMVSGDIAKYEDGTTGAGGTRYAFGHAVDYRRLRSGQMSQRGQDFGFSKENLYTSIGFDVPSDLNSRMNSKKSNVDLGEYRKAIQNKESLRTMTSRLIDAGFPPKQAHSIAKEIRNNLLKSTKGLPDNTKINDNWIYSRMGNDKSGIIGGLVKSKNPVISAAAQELFQRGSRSMGGTLSLDKVFNNLKLSNPNVQKGTASINDVISATRGKISQLALDPLKKLSQMDPNMELSVIKDARGNIIGFERPEVKPDGTLSQSKSAIGLLRGNKFDIERSIGSSNRQIKFTKTASEAFDRLIGKKVAVKPGQKVIDLETGARVPAKRVPLTAADKNRIPSGQKLSHSRAFMLRRGQGIPALGATAEDGESMGGNKYTRTDSGLLVPEKVIKEQTDALIKNTESQDEGRKSQDKNTSTQEKSTKEISRDQRSARAQRIGNYSGPAAMAAGTAGMVAAMAGAPQVMTNFLFGVSAVAGVLPLLANPLGAVAAGLALSSLAIYKYISDINKARKEGIEFAKAMTMGADKIRELSILTNTVSATEEARRRRENIAAGSGEGQRRFGQNILESDFGKSILADIDAQAKSGLNAQEISKNIATNLSQAVMQGVVTTEQARSIASALGEKLGSYEIPALISGNLVKLLGPEGQDLFTDPLSVALQIKTDSMDNVKFAFEEALSGAGANAAAASIPAWQKIVDFLPIDPGYFAVKAGQAQQEKMNAAAVGLGAQMIGQNQQLIDGLNKQYDIKIRSAKTEKEIKDLEDERKNKIDELNKANAKTLQDVLSMSDKLSGGSFTKAVNAAVDSLYKNSSDAVKTFATNAKNQLGQLEDTPFKKTIQLGFASGELNPATVTKILDFAAANKGIEGKINFLISQEGFANTDLLMQLFAKTGANANTVDIMLNYVNTNKVDFDKDLAAVSAISNMQGTYGVTLNLKTNGIQQITNTQAALTAIEKLPPKLNFELVSKLAGENPAVFGAIKDNWIQLSEGKDTINKNLVVNYTIGSVDPNIKAAAKTEGVSVAEYLAKGFIEPAPTKPTTTTTTTTNTKGRDTTLDELLKRLKFIRNAAINAQGGVKELLRITSGNGLAKFGGVMQQLMAGPKGGANREFIAFLEGMDNATRKTYMTVKNGQVVLTKQGKALKEAFDERAIGEFQVAQAQTIQDTIAQRAALLKLKSAGVDNATALEMVADASLAVAINSKDISSKEISQMAKDANRAKKEIADLNLEVQNLGVSITDKIKNLNTTVTALKAAKASGITNEDLLQYIASNQALADQIARKGINDPVVQGIIKNQPKIEDLEGAISGLVSPLTKIQSDFDKAREKAEKFYQYLENQANASYKKWLQDTKVTFEGVSYSIEEGLQKAQDKIAEYQEQIDDANRDIELNFDRPMEALREEIDDIQRDIELQFDRPIEGLQREINGLQRQIEMQFDRPIQALQDESGRLSNDLTLMDKAAEGINKRYDEQEAALNKISELNQDIIAQEKQRISLADAITQGDISVAAQAAQDMRAAAAASAAARAGGTLQTARDAEIANLRSASGMTRDQIEARQFQIGQQIFALEQQRSVIQAQILEKQDKIYALEQAKIPYLDLIRDKEDQIYALQEQKEAALLKIRDIEDKIYEINEKTVEPIQSQLEKRERQLKAELDAIDAQKKKWDEAQTAIDGAKIKADGFAESLDASESSIQSIVDLYNSITDKVVTLTINQVGGLNSGATSPEQKAYDDELAKINSLPLGDNRNSLYLAFKEKYPNGRPMMYGGKVKPMQYGGRVGSDFVPSLLTPGEFVVNKRAANAFGPLLSAMNGSKYPSMLSGNMLAQPSYKISSPSSFSMPVQNSMSNTSNSSSAVYNYNVGITVNGTNVTPNSIARTVIDQIKYIDSQKIVGQRAG